MHQRSKLYLSFLVALLAVSDEAVCVLGLQAASSNKNSPLRNTNNAVYYTSSSRSRCLSPRPVTSIKTDFKRDRTSSDVEHDSLLVSSSPIFIPYASSSSSSNLKTIRIVSPTTTGPVVSKVEGNSIETAAPSSAKAATTSTSTTTPSSSKVPPAAVVNLACALAANSGFLNGLGLSGILGKAGSVAAVTGTYTNAAVAFSSSLKPAALLAILATPLCYALGSMVNGLLNPEGPPSDMSQLSFLQSSPLMLAGLGVLLVNAFKTQIAPTFCLLSFCIGLQNSFTTNMVQGNLFRTAHMSGITSDIGTIMGQVMRGNHANAFKLPIFAKLATSFWAGGMLSVLGLQHCGSLVTASTCCTMSAMLYFGLWMAWTEPLRHMVAASSQQVVARGHPFVQAALASKQIRRYRARRRRLLARS